jgi:hypothetical protein
VVLLPLGLLVLLPLLLCAGRLYVCVAARDRL